MKRVILVAMAALSLGACTSPLLSVLPGAVPAPPAPLAKTTVDEKALDAAWRGLDASLDAINLAMDLKPSLIGTPGAVKVANAIDAVTAALTAAESAAASQEATNYADAMAKAKQAFVELRLAIQALKGK